MSEFAWSHATFKDWQAFRDAPSPFKFDTILDRNQLPLPDWFVSPAHGAVIPSQYYLSQIAGFNPQTYQSHGWRRLNRVDGYHKMGRDHRYLSRRCGSLFSVERSWGRVCACGSVLAHRFASTPVFARTLEEAKYLAQLKQPPSDLRWVTLLPRDPNNYTYGDAARDYNSVFFAKLTR